MTQGLWGQPVFPYILLSYWRLRHRIFHIEGWVYFLWQVRELFFIPNLIFLIFWGFLTVFLPFWLLSKITRYKNKKRDLPNIYLNFLPKRFLISEIFPYPLGMTNGFLVFYLIFVFLINLYYNLIIAVIFGGLTIISCLIAYLFVVKDKNRDFRKKYLIGFILYLIIAFIVNISL